MVDFSTVRGGTAFDSDGSKVGSIDEIYTDKDTGEPTFVTVHMGLFGTRTTFIPLAEATVQGNDLRVPYAKALIKDAPNVDPDMDISDEEQDRLYSHYGLAGGGAAYDTVGGSASGAAAHDTVGTTAPTAGLTDTTRAATDTTRAATDTTRAATDTTDDAMTRSEERLRVGVQRQEAGRARLRKYVVTEQQTANVQVSHDELRIEREPITDANRGDAFDGPAISEQVHEVVLSEEHAVVDKEVVPVERIRIGKETVTETETVSGEVRKEQIELDAPEGVDVHGQGSTTGDRKTR